PASAINNITDGATLSTVTAVSGTASDLSAANRTKVSRVQLNIYDKTTGEVYKPGDSQDGGSGWFIPTGPNPTNPQDARYWNAVTYTPYQVGAASGTWSYSFPDIGTRGGQQFQLISQAIDL